MRGELINKLEAAMVLDLKKQLKIGNFPTNKIYLDEILRNGEIDKNSV